MAFLTKQKAQILSSALQKVTSTTNISNISPGSVARALIEIITSELSDFYGILDFNTQQNVISQASGSSLDLIGALYNTIRKNITDLAIIDRSLGSFYFYIDSPYFRDITIPNGTNIFTDNTTFIGQQFSYQSVGDVIIAAGHLKSWASIRPNFSNAPFTAGINTLTLIDPNYPQPTGVVVKCTNPKAIQAQATTETDEDYRTRITAAVRTASGGTVQAMRMAALNVSGVRDVTIRNVPYGLGSVEVLVVTDDNVTNSPVINTVATLLDNVRPAGVRMWISQPMLIPVDVTANLVLNNNLPSTSLTVSSVIQRTQNAITRFLNAPLVATPLIYNQLIQAILDSSDIIVDVIILSYAVDGVQVLRKNYTPESNQQLIPGSVNIGIANS